MKFFFICFIINLFTLKLFSQEDLSRNFFYVELLGNGEYFSFNYERKFYPKFMKKATISLRQGVSLFGRIDKTTLWGFPSEVNIQLGNQKHMAEFGIGFTPFIGNSKLDTLSVLPEGHRTNFDYSFFLRPGYRLETNRGTIIRIGPMIRLYHSPPQNPNLGIGFWPGFAIGVWW